MAGRFHVENASEEAFDFVCGPCHVDGEVTQAKGYCSNCQDYLCEFCLKQHLRPKPMRHHVLLDENSMPKDVKATPSTTVKASDICTERCPKHSGNIIEYYCQNHDCLGCTKCFISDNHRMCKGVVCIEDTIAGLYESQEYKTYAGKIEHIVNNVKKSSSIKQENDENIKMYSIRAKKEIQNFRKEMNEFLDRLEHEMGKQVLQMKESQTSKWMSISKKVEQLDIDIKTIKHTENQTRTSRQLCNSYINMKRNVHQLKQLEDQMVAVEKEITVSEYTFKPEVGLQNIIKDTRTFGKLVTCKEEVGLQNILKDTKTFGKLVTCKEVDLQNILKDTKTFGRLVTCKAPNPTTTPARRDSSELIAALEQQLNYHRIGGLAREQYEDAIKSVKANRRVDFDFLHATQRYPPLPRALWDAYNKFHGY